MGRHSLNLLGGQPTVNRVAAEDEPFLDITVANVSVCMGSYKLDLECIVLTLPWCNLLIGSYVVTSFHSTIFKSKHT